MACQAGGVRTEHENLWAGEFGLAYTRRNQTPEITASNCALFARILSRMQPIKSVLELGANLGANLDAIQLLLPDARQTAVEINPDAADACARHGRLVHNCAISEFMPRGEQWDLVLAKGILIHVEPATLPEVYRQMMMCARRYIVIAEYYSPQPYSVSYRGVEDAIHKRDFAGEMLDRFPELRVVDYGFVWRRDRFAQDDITWFLLERLGAAHAYDLPDAGVR